MSASDPRQKPRIALPDDGDPSLEAGRVSDRAAPGARPVGGGSTAGRGGRTAASWSPSAISDLAPLPGFLRRKIWGVKVSLLLVYAFIAMLAVAVQLFKLSSSSQHEEIKGLERLIAKEKRELRALKAEAASLEQPERLEILARSQLGMEPEQAEREIEPGQLLDVAAGTFKPIKSTVPKVVALPAPDPAPEKPSPVKPTTETAR